jgi:hypothetical protein
MSQMEVNSVYSTPRGSRFLHTRDSGHWFSPGRIIGFLLGAALTVVGAIALMKTGVSSDLNTPLTTVFGLTHSPAVGLMELAAGLLILVSSASEASRPAIGFIGVLLLAAGIIGAVSSLEIQSKVGFEPNTAWFFALCGFIALVASMLPAVWSERHEVAEMQ